MTNRPWFPSCIFKSVFLWEVTSYFPHKPIPLFPPTPIKVCFPSLLVPFLHSFIDYDKNNRPCGMLANLPPPPLHTFFMSAHAVEGGLGEHYWTGRGRGLPDLVVEARAKTDKTGFCPIVVFVQQTSPPPHSAKSLESQNLVMKCWSLATWQIDSKRGTLSLYRQCSLSSGWGPFNQASPYGCPNFP